jgi:hypothetical protein
MAIPTAMVRPSCLTGGMYCFPDVYVDITDVIELKIRALDKMVSQQYAGAYARKRVEAVDGSLGLFTRVAYAEGFITYWPEVYDYLPVTETRLERANELEAAGMARTDILLAHTVPMPEGCKWPGE